MLPYFIDLVDDVLLAFFEILLEATLDLEAKWQKHLCAAEDFLNSAYHKVFLIGLVSQLNLI